MSELVLVVDDSPATRKFVAFALRLGGCRVLEAMDGQDALEQVARNPSISLVITDLNMPNLDGLGLLNELKTNPATASIPVVVLSSEQDAPVRQQSQSAGADAYLVKPFQTEELQQVVERFLGPTRKSA